MKRTLDVVLSVFLLVALGPLLALVWVLVRVTSPGPALFRQYRVGRNFTPFELVKFRTMGHAQAGLAYTLGADPRITGLGKWLRRTKIDELPQLWNVLRGEMSLVGPRPVIPELVAEFVSDYRSLLVARPGLTDPASLKYSQEAWILMRARDPIGYFKHVVTPDKLQISLDYQRKAGFWSDLVILATTVMICIFPALSRMYGKVAEYVAQEDAGLGLMRGGALRKPMHHVGAGLEDYTGPMTASPWNVLPSALYSKQTALKKASGRRFHL